MRPKDKNRQEQKLKKNSNRVRWKRADKGTIINNPITDTIIMTNAKVGNEWHLRITN